MRFNATVNQLESETVEQMLEGGTRRTDSADQGEIQPRAGCKF